jgi:hypothetical protein
MLYEYALEPELLNNWKDFRYFIEKFGVSNGRLISRYPSSWKKMVYEAAAQCPPMEKKRIEEKLKLLENRVLVTRVSEWNEDLTWISNTIEEHSKRPFHAIIARENSNNHNRILVADELDNEHPLMQSPTNFAITRTAEEMALCVRNLLLFSKKIIFIDPYFSPSSKRHIRPLSEFLKIVLEAIATGLSKSVELVYHTSNFQSEISFKKHCKTKLPKLIPKGLTLNLVRWNKKQLHNRYILTDIGGVSFETGLDDNNFGASTEKDDVNILGEERYQELWQLFNSKPVFLKVVGTK